LYEEVQRRAITFTLDRQPIESTHSDAEPARAYLWTKLADQKGIAIEPFGSCQLCISELSVNRRKNRALHLHFVGLVQKTIRDRLLRTSVTDFYMKPDTDQPITKM
jgi:hypothetical protein